MAKSTPQNIFNCQSSEKRINGIVPEPHDKEFNAASSIVVLSLYRELKASVIIILCSREYTLVMLLG